jgi:hypothetical protein
VDKKNAVVELHDAIQEAAASRGWKAKPHRPPVTRQNKEFSPVADTSWIPWLTKDKNNFS